MWFVYALLSAVITALGQVLVKKGQLELTPLLDNLLATFIVNLILVPLLIFTGVDPNAGGSIWIYALIAAIMYFSFYYIISLGNVSLMISLINTFPVVTIMLAIVFLRELPSLYQLMGIAFVILGTISISQKKNGGGEASGKNNWIIWGLCGSLAIGIAEFVTKLGTLYVDGATFTFFVYVFYIPPLTVTMLLDKGGRKFERLRSIPNLIYTIIGILCIELGLIGIAFAYQHGPASLVSPIVATHLLITAILANLFLKEKLLKTQKMGVLLSLIGIITIGIS